MYESLFYKKIFIDLFTKNHFFSFIYKNKIISFMKKDLKHTMYFEQFVESQNGEQINELFGMSSAEKFEKLDQSDDTAVDKFFNDYFMTQSDNKKGAIVGGVSKMTTGDKLAVLNDAKADAFKSNFLWFDKNNKIRYKKSDELKLKGGLDSGKSWIK
jgi:hypothetical protein